MIIVLIFFLHFVFGCFVFYKKWKTESPVSGIINVIFLIIIFAVGWSLSTMFVKLFFENEGFGKHFDRDTISLTLLSLVEFFFYRKYYKGLRSTPIEKEKQ